MQAQARAGIEFSDSVLRYAEVEQYGSRFRLLRLGTCDFDFGLVDDLLYRHDPDAVDVVREALQDVFSGSIASSLHAALHPSLTASFFTSVPAGLSPEERQYRLTTESMLVTGARSTSDLSISSSEVGVRHENGDVELSVLATEPKVRKGLDLLLSDMNVPSQGLRLTTEGAALIMRHLWSRRGVTGDPTRPVALGIGGYPGSVEFTVTRRGDWVFSHFARATTAVDYAYFAGTVLERIGVYPDELGTVYLYGAQLPANCVEVLSAVWDAVVERLNPLEIVDLDPDTLAGEFASEAYVPCIGAAL
jgi:hypothetical protein